MVTKRIDSCGFLVFPPYGGRLPILPECNEPRTQKVHVRCPLHKLSLPQPQRLQALALVHLLGSACPAKQVGRRVLAGISDKTTAKAAATTSP